MLEAQYRERIKKKKTKDKQYLEQTSQSLACTPLTETVQLDYFESKDDGKTVTTKAGSAMRKLDGWFTVSLVNGQEIKVRKFDLFNVKKYMIKRKQVYVSSRDNAINKRQIRRESKRREEEMIRIR